MSGKIKIWSDGIPAHTRIVVVDADGKETKLETVQTVEYLLDSEEDRGLRPGRLRLGFVFGNVVELDMNADSGVVTRLIELDREPLLQRPHVPRDDSDGGAWRVSEIDTLAVGDRTFGLRLKERRLKVGDVEVVQDTAGLGLRVTFGAGDPILIPAASRWDLLEALRRVLGEEHRASSQDGAS